MVPQGRIELPTSPLPRVRSTTELLRRTGESCVFSLVLNARAGRVQACTFWRVTVITLTTVLGQGMYCLGVIIQCSVHVAHYHLQIFVSE